MDDSPLSGLGYNQSGFTARDAIHPDLIRKALEVGEYSLEINLSHAKTSGTERPLGRIDAYDTLGVRLTGVLATQPGATFPIKANGTYRFETIGVNQTDLRTVCAQVTENSTIYDNPDIGGSIHRQVAGCKGTGHSVGIRADNRAGSIDLENFGRIRVLYYPEVVCRRIDRDAIRIDRSQRGIATVLLRSEVDAHQTRRCPNTTPDLILPIDHASEDSSTRVRKWNWWLENPIAGVFLIAP